MSAKAKCSNAQTHGEADTSSWCYFHVQPRPVTVQKFRNDSAATQNPSQKCQNRTTEGNDGRVVGGEQTVCDKRKASWEITGLLHEPQGRRDPERAKEEKAGRRQDWNSLTLFGGLEVFA